MTKAAGKSPEKSIEFDIPYYAMHMDSFDELVDSTRHKDAVLVMMEAIGFHKFYEQNVLDVPGKEMVLFHKKGELYLINDEITEEHSLIESVKFHLPESEFEGVEDFDPQTISDRIARCLVLYEHIMQGRSDKMELGVYDRASGTVAVLSMGMVQKDPATPEKLPPLPPAMRLQ